MDSAGFGDIVSGLFGGEGDGRTAGLLMAAGIALLTMIMLRRVWKRRGATPSGGERLSAKERVARASELAGGRGAARPRETLEQLMVEVQELTRVCAAQMENRALRLEKLIREADERIRRLEQLEGRGGSELPRGVEFGGRAVGARTVGAVSAPGRAQGVSSLLVQDDVDPVTRRVYGLADQGLTPVEIAGKLEEQVGKVELILALRGH
jgi:hypothetical protein